VDHHGAILRGVIFGLRYLLLSELLHRHIRGSFQRFLKGESRERRWMSWSNITRRHIQFKIPTSIFPLHGQIRGVRLALFSVFKRVDGMDPGGNGGGTITSTTPLPGPGAF